MQIKLKKMVILALFIALCFIGSVIKMPSITGTVAFDSMPAFLAASLLGPVPGAAVGLLGHLMTAASAGFPLSLPIHLLIGFQMAVILWIYGILFKKVNRYLAAIVAVLLNGVAAPAMLMLLPSLGMAFIAAMVLPLTVGSLINVLVALIVHASLERVEVIKRMKVFSFGE
jgi:predicted membrane protein